MTLRPYQKAAVDAVKRHMITSKDFCIIEAATGCHEKGHPILMYDGSIIPVEQVKIGDKVMGPNSKPREVINLHRGKQQFYKVTPVKGESFEINKEHIFNFYKTPAKFGQEAEYFNATIKEYLSFLPFQKHRTKLHRTHINFRKNYLLPIDPWVLGVFLGDGCLTAGPIFSSPEKEIIKKMGKYAKHLGLKLSEHKKKDTCSSFRFCKKIHRDGRPNFFSDILKKIGLYGKKSHDKFIPFTYKTSSRENRLKLLAGLIDTDGSLTRGGYDYISKSEALADDIIFLCRSLGFAAYKTRCVKSCQNNFSATYFRVSISGDCTVIPCEVKRKKAPKRKQIKNVLVTGFHLEKTTIKNYYGFELDQDHLYVDGHFNVHHNSGKSHMVAHLAEWVTKGRKDKHCLCLAPSKELVEQNHQKYINAGFKASIFSASAGQKCLSHNVIFGTPLTVLNSIKHFPAISLLIIDEAHGITRTIKSIIAHLLAIHSEMRVLGLTATPYRRGEGYIYQCDEQNELVYDPEKSKHKPYFIKKVFTIQAKELIDNGFLTPMVTGETLEHYDTRKLEKNSMGNFTSETVEQAFVGLGRLTSAIVADVVERSQNRKGVLLFAATIAHAKEILESLPKGSRLIIGDTDKTERERTINEFKAKRFKYLVNVGVLTTGFDAPHVDVVAVLRATESAALFQQIIGRALRLADGKENALLLDYGENIERHYLQDDLFTPVIDTPEKSNNEDEIIIKEVDCPFCFHTNKFKARGKTEHFGRRCQAMALNPETKKFEQCIYRFEFKLCGECNTENDITARYCESCRSELIDPNEKLKLEAFGRKRGDYSMPTVFQVLEWNVERAMSQAGNETIKVSYKTDKRKIEYWYMPKIKRVWDDFCMTVYNEKMPTVEAFMSLIPHIKRPLTFTAKKKPGSKYFVIYGYNQPVPESDIQAESSLG